MEEQKQQNETEKVEAKLSDSVKGKNTGMAVVAYILFFVPLLTESKNDHFVKYHVKQGFVLFVTAVISSILFMVPIFIVIGMVLQLAVLVLFIIGIMNALGGKEEPLPVIGQFADKVSF